MGNPVNRIGMPLGLGMELSQNVDALNRFASLSPRQQEMVKRHTSAIMSKQEMKSYVQDLAAGKVSLQ